MPDIESSTQPAPDKGAIPASPSPEEKAVPALFSPQEKAVPALLSPRESFRADRPVTTVRTHAHRPWNTNTGDDIKSDCAEIDVEVSNRARALARQGTPTSTSSGSYRIDVDNTDMLPVRQRFNAVNKYWTKKANRKLRRAERMARRAGPQSLTIKPGDEYCS
jgi:hypothetical protein